MERVKRWLTFNTIAVLRATGKEETGPQTSSIHSYQGTEVRLPFYIITPPTGVQDTSCHLSGTLEHT